MHERRLRARLPGGLEEVQRADRVGVEVVERNCGRAIVRRLGGGVNDRVGLQLPYEPSDARAIANVELVMRERLQRGLEAALIPARVALLTEEDRALVVVDAVDAPPQLGKIRGDFRSDQAG